MAVAARVSARLAALRVSAEHALLIGIATLEAEAQRRRDLQRDRADVVPMFVKPYSRRNGAGMELEREGPEAPAAEVVAGVGGAGGAGLAEEA